MKSPTRIVSFSDQPALRTQQFIHREWLVTAGNGSYACGTLGFVNTRRHHGLLIANLLAPQGRTLSLASLRDEVVDQDNDSLAKFWGLETRSSPSSSPENVGSPESAGDAESAGHGELHIHGAPFLESFRLDCGFPTWTYRVGESLIEKSIVMPHRTDSVCIQYRLIRGDTPRTLRLRPMIQFRGHNDSVSTPCRTTCTTHGDRRFEFVGVESGHRMNVRFNDAASFHDDPHVEPQCLYRVEHARGYDHQGELGSPGFFDVLIGHERPLIFVAELAKPSDKEPEGRGRVRFDDLFENERRRRQQLIQIAKLPSDDGVEAELVLAADQFIIRPASRRSDEQVAEAADGSNTGSDLLGPANSAVEASDHPRSVIAGYPWFTDWGRDTMISLPGLTLATGRPDDAKRILLTFGDYVRDGLIPNLFPEGGQEGMYHTADATLWFFQAIHEYVAATRDESILQRLLPKLKQIIDAHFAGTKFGIHVDKNDGLLVQGQHDVQLTWMDAKAGDWVVTPRRGKAVEINALWYNALHLYCNWIEAYDPASDASLLRPRLNQAQNSFNRRFWYEDGDYLYDVVDGENGDDHSLRPNQLFAISLANPVLDMRRSGAVLDCVIDQLLTPVGLRSLTTTSPDYLGHYHGDVYRRDAAYHQGTVWSWLIGPLIKAWCRVQPNRRDEALPWLNGLTAHLGEACLGQVSEIFEGDPPHKPKGCFAQAWSVAELLEARRLISSQ